MANMPHWSRFKKSHSGGIPTRILFGFLNMRASYVSLTNSPEIEVTKKSRDDSVNAPRNAEGILRRPLSSIRAGW